MARPDAYDTPIPWTHKCIVCTKEVGTEPLYDNEGRIRGYTPASRYWHDDGVFCGVYCGLKYRDASERNRGLEGRSDHAA